MKHKALTSNGKLVDLKADNLLCAIDELMECKHRWIKKQYHGISVIAKWDMCECCGAERNREVQHL